MKMGISIAFFLFLAISTIAQANDFDITKYGGKPGGDITTVSVFLICEFMND